jgi:cytochrome c oxidase subunit 2
LNDLLRRILALPEQASTMAAEIDHLHFLVIITTMCGAVLVGGTAVYFAIRYRRRDDDQTGTVTAPHRFFELGITAVLLVMFVWWWWIGYRQYLHLQTAPAGAMEIYVSAKQWMWKFSYGDGRRTISLLVVPTGRPIKLLMLSRDVIHGFFVPDFRIKHDIVPGSVASVWFQCDAPGIHQILCTQYCGTSHSHMRGSVVAISPGDFAAWRMGRHIPLVQRALADEIAWRARVAAANDVVPDQLGADTGIPVSDADIDMAKGGREVAARHGCLACHTEDGQAHIGPTWRGLFGSQVRLADGRTVLADEQYLTRSMMDPQADIVEGYQPIMPTYLGQLDAVQTAALVEFIKSLQSPLATPANPHLPPVVPLQGNTNGR